MLNDSAVEWLNINLWLFSFGKLILFSTLSPLNSLKKDICFRNQWCSFIHGFTHHRSEIEFSISIAKYHLSYRTICIDERKAKCKEQLRVISTSFPPGHLISQSQLPTRRALMKSQFKNLLVSHGIGFFLYNQERRSFPMNVLGKKT